MGHHGQVCLLCQAEKMGKIGKRIGALSPYYLNRLREWRETQRKNDQQLQQGGFHIVMHRTIILIRRPISL